MLWQRLLSGVLLCGNVAAAEPPRDVLQAWFKPTHVTLRASSAGSADLQEFDYDLAASGDLRVHVVSHARSGKTEGDLMLVKGMLLVKGLPLERGAEIDAVDVPALTLQLASKLLAAAAGKVPRELRGKVSVDLHESDWTIQVGTPSAAGEYPAPWSLRGSLEARSPGTVAFDLTHAYMLDDQAAQVRYAGLWQQTGQAFKLDNAMPLSGWHVFRLGPTRGSAGAGSTTYDYAATALRDAPKTLGELRRSADAAAPAQ